MGERLGPGGNGVATEAGSEERALFRIRERQDWRGRVVKLGAWG